MRDCFHSWFRRGAGAVALSLTVGLAGGLLPADTLAADQPPLELDVPYVPTRTEVVSRMLQMAQVGQSDFLVDLGSGDGRIPVTAVRDFGAKGAFGVDINPVRVDEAQANARQAGVSDRVEFRVQDLFKTDFSQATVLSMYLLPDVNLKLRPTILDLAPGTRVVSHDFSMGDWESDEFDQVGNSRVYLWIVPAKVDGAWQVTGPDGEFALDLNQAFQKLEGRADGQGTVSGELRGADIRFDIDRGSGVQRYVGRVQGNTMVAVDAPEAVQGWRAMRR